MVNVNELELTKLLVYGTTTPGSDPNTHIRPNAASSAPPPISISMIDYLTTGAGRYAKPSEAPLIKAFFADAALATPVLANGNYTVATLTAALGLTPSPDLLRLNVSQYTTDPGSSDFIERAYVFGSTGFDLANIMTFTVNSGTYTVNNLELRALQDNFDFQSSNPIASTANVLLNSALDPYGLIPVVGSNTIPVDILYTGSGRQYATYSKADFNTDKTLVDGWSSSSIAAANFAVALAGLATNTGYLGTINADRYFRYYTPDGKKVIYGTPDDDNLTVLSAEVTLDVYFDYQMVGGDGNDNITGGNFGDELWGGAGNDTLNGGLGDDIFIGGKGDDTMDGGSFLFGLFEGTDSSKYEGALSEYDIEFLPDDIVRITDKVGDRDGTDTLKGVDIGVFSDKSINLGPGQDIAFVIDTTGSMFDDIAQVKARSNEIITAIFDGDRSVLNSRIAVVGYNDPGTNTFLTFTDQPKIDDRKTAAINAINSISVGGGGDFPEVVNAGLLRALNGGAGEWREEAIARRIILFGDAPPKDNELRSQVLALAANLKVSLPSSPSFMSIAGDIETNIITDGLSLTTLAITTVNAEGEERTVSVEIFTVRIGFDSTTGDDFASLAEATGGKAFTADNASEVVDALITALETPIAPTLVIAATDANKVEGNSGNMPFTFTVTRSGDTSGTSSVAYAVTGSATNPANAADFGGNLPSGTVTFGAGDTTKTITVDVSGDTIVEPDEGFTVILSSPTDATISAATATGTIVNDDNAPSDTITGTEEDDVLVGTSADNLMIGLGGNDRLDGKGGADEMRGGLGNDFYMVNDPGDLVIESASEGTDAVKASVTYALPDHVENLTLLGTGNLDGTGNALNNKLTGNNGNNLLMGGAGNDTLDGKAGNDLLQGETGDDTYFYRHPGSVIVENPNEGTDTVKAYFSYGLGANLENLVLMGSDDLDGIGNSLDNKLAGNSGDNLLNGGPGADTLMGKAGADVFIFNFGQSLVTAPDWIKDFTLGEDKIDLLTQGGRNVNTPVSFTRAADSKATTLTEVMTQVFTDADGALEGNQALGINSAALVKVLTADIRGTYLVVNNGNALFQADKDLLINITSLKGGLPDFGAIAVDSFFV